MRPRIIRLAGIGLIAVVTLVVYEDYSTDNAAWNKVQESLIRLSSGIEFEPIISLRSKIADTDAAIKTYQSRVHLIPRHTSNLESANRGIRYMAIALENGMTNYSWNDMQQYLDVVPLVEHSCDGDHLAFSSVKGGFEIRAAYLIKLAAGELSDLNKSAQHSTQPLDFAKENDLCQKQYAESMRAAAQASAEKAIQDAERARETAENARVTLEKERAAAQAGAEKSKQDAERARETAERERAAAQAEAEAVRKTTAAQAAAEKERAAVKAVAEKERAAAHQAAWKYHIDVSVGGGCEVLSARMDGQQPKRLYASSFHLDANQTVELISGLHRCQIISVTINGAKYEPAWQTVPDNNFIYTARIVPMN